MKKFNVKVLSMAVTAAVASGAAGAAEQNFAAAVGGKDDQGQAAFFTVFGEGTTYDKGTGKLTFKKDSDALLLKTMELEQTINGFASGSDFITTDANGNKTVRKATNEDIEADSLKGVGLAGGLDNLANALDDQDETIEELKTAITTNGTRIAEVATGVNKLNESVAEISTKFDEVDSEISKASSELSESIEKVSEDVTAVNKRVDTLEQETAAAKTSAKAAEDKVTELSANVDSKVTEAKDAAKAAEDKVTALSANIDSKVKEAKDAAANAVDAASKIDAVAEKADKANKAVDELAERAALSIAENTQKFDGFKEGDEIVFTDADGIKSVKKATKEDVEQDEFGGLGLKEVVAQHDQSLADLTAETERAKKAAEQAAFAAIENAQELNGFKDGDEIVVTDDDGVKSTRKATQADVEADGFGGLGLKEVVAAHDEALGDLTETVNENSEALVKTAEVVNAISADVNANKAALEEQKEANEGFNNAIASLDKDIGDLALAGKAAADALEANRQDIDANKAAIETKADKTAVESVRTLAVEAQKSAQTAKGAVEVAQKSAENADSHAKAAQTAAAKAQESADTNAVQIVANTKQINTNKTDIAALQTANGQHAAGIAKNSARIDSLDRDVANLRKETRQGLAAQAALSGLFQPYSVGKFNVTAALGGFKSDTAVAVGAGYRFNENFAAKAGLAVGTSSGGSASYNVGLNYEW